jgi:hypothetical protein
MASSGKKKTTMAKLMRESRLRERRQDKKAKKDARKLAPPQTEFPSNLLIGDEDEIAVANGEQGESGPSAPDQAAAEPLVEAPADA